MQATETQHILPRVLIIGTDSNVLKEGSEHRARMLRYASTMAELHIVVLGAQGVVDEKMQIGEHVFAYPTHTASRARALVEGLRIGKRIAAQHTIDIISTQDPFETALLGYLIKRQCDARLQIQEHGDFFSQPYWRGEKVLHMLRYMLGSWLIHRADCVRVVSERTKRYLIQKGRDEQTMCSVPLRTDVTTFQNIAPDQSVDVLRPDGGVLILTIGRFVPQKNLCMLLRAFRRVLESGANARLVLVGQGPEKDNLLACAGDLVPDKVTFLDWTDDPAGIIKAADVYALSSNYEGWGRVCIESLAAGTPIVMTDVGCAGEVVRDNENGLVVPVDDEDAFTAALEHLVHDQALRDRLASAGIETVQTLPTQEEHRALYKKSLECCIVDPHATTHSETKEQTRADNQTS